MVVGAEPGCPETDSGNRFPTGMELEMLVQNVTSAVDYYPVHRQHGSWYDIHTFHRHSNLYVAVNQNQAEGQIQGLS